MPGIEEQAGEEQPHACGARKAEGPCLSSTDFEVDSISGVGMMR